MGKQKHNKARCKKCIYRGYIGHNGPQQDIACLRCLFVHEACLSYDGTDKRGDDPEDCKFFKEGPALKNVPAMPDFTNWSGERYRLKRR